MKSNLLFGLALAVPLALFAGCSSDDDDTTSNGGTGGASAGRDGTSSGGRAANGGKGGRAGSANGGEAGGGIGVAGAGGSQESAGAGGDAAAGETGDGGTAGALASLDDAQILKVLSTANSGEVSVAQVAKPALKNSAAVSFAQMMIDEHGAANAQTLALVSSKHLAPTPSEVSEALEVDTAAVIATLSKTAPAAFDKVYIGSQVTMHQQVLTLIDSRLIPDASDADLKALLSTLRTSVAAHLSAATAINTTLP